MAKSIDQFVKHAWTVALGKEECEHCDKVLSWNVGSLAWASVYLAKVLSLAVFPLGEKWSATFSLPAAGSKKYKHSWETKDASTRRDHKVEQYLFFVRAEALASYGADHELPTSLTLNQWTLIKNMVTLLEEQLMRSPLLKR